MDVFAVQNKLQGKKMPLQELATAKNTVDLYLGDNSTNLLS